MGLQSGSELLAKHAANVDRDKTVETHEFLQLCISEFGMGDRPDLRATWWERFGETLQDRGSKPMGIAKKIRRSSRGKNNPGRYFVTCITRAFEEQGWW